FPTKLQPPDAGLGVGNGLLEQAPARKVEYLDLGGRVRDQGERKREARARRPQHGESESCASASCCRFWRRRRADSAALDRDGAANIRCFGCGPQQPCHGLAGTECERVDGESQQQIEVPIPIRVSARNVELAESRRKMSTREGHRGKQQRL